MAGDWGSRCGEGQGRGGRDDGKAGSSSLGGNSLQARRGNANLAPVWVAGVGRMDDLGFGSPERCFGRTRDEDGRSR